LVYAANAMSWMVTDLSVPATVNRPGSQSRSFGLASSRWAAISRAFSRSLRETIAVAAPPTGVEREA
jgi:hypothetical protein